MKIFSEWKIFEIFNHSIYSGELYEPSFPFLLYSFFLFIPLFFIHLFFIFLCYCRCSLSTYRIQMWQYLHFSALMKTSQNQTSSDIPHYLSHVYNLASVLLVCVIAVDREREIINSLHYLWGLVWKCCQNQHLSSPLL